MTSCSDESLGCLVLLVRCQVSSCFETKCRCLRLIALPLQLLIAYYFHLFYDAILCYHSTSASRLCNDGGDFGGHLSDDYSVGHFDGPAQTGEVARCRLRAPLAPAARCLLRNKFVLDVLRVNRPSCCLLETILCQIFCRFELLIIGLKCFDIFSF